MEVFLRLVIAAGLSLLGLSLYWGWSRWLLRRVGRRRPAGLLGLEGLRPGVQAILYFTTPNCVPCHTVQRPALERLQSELAQNLQVVEVDASARPSVADYWGVLSVPTTFVIDATGQPRRVNHGVASAEKLRQQLEEIGPGAGRRAAGQKDAAALPLEP